MKIERITGISPITRVNNASIEKNEEIMEREENKISRGDISSNLEEEEELSIGEQKFIEAIERANKSLRGVDKRFEFSIHEGTKKIMVKVINEETNEVIKEIPPEKILDLVAQIWELAGILVDRKI